MLPAWEGDPLSAFLSQAEWNERVSVLKLPDIYALLRHVHATFQQVTTITQAISSARNRPVASAPGRPVSESGRLCYGDGNQGRGNRGRRAVHVAFAPAAVGDLQT